MYRSTSSSTHRATGSENPDSGQNLEGTALYETGQGILTGKIEKVSDELFIVQQRDRQPIMAPVTKRPARCHRLTCPGEIFKSLQDFARLP